MTQTIILHVLAAVIWLLAIGMAMIYTKHDISGYDNKANTSAVLLLVLSLAAFTLQVIA